VETASWRVPRNVDIVDPAATERLITAAHANGMRVVAWYLPGLVDRAIDMRRIRAALDFKTVDGQGFDSFALDIEANAVNPVWKRNASLLKLSRDIRREVGQGYPLGAIVPDQLSTSWGNVLAGLPVCGRGEVLRRLLADGVLELQPGQGREGRLRLHGRKRPLRAQRDGAARARHRRDDRQHARVRAGRRRTSRPRRRRVRRVALQVPAVRRGVVGGAELVRR
jgi:hypothetical protein